MKRSFIIRILLILLTGWIGVSALYSQYPGQFSDLLAIKPMATIKAYSFDLNDIRLLNGPFRDNMLREGKWLLSINIINYSN